MTSSAFAGSLQAQARSWDEVAYPGATDYRGIDVENNQGSHISAANIYVPVGGYAYHEMLGSGTFALSSDHDLVFDLTEPGT